MDNFTKEQIEQLKCCELNFHHAVEANYISRERETNANLVREIWEQHTGQNLGKGWSPNCSVCVLNLFKKVGKLYFDSIKFYEEQEKELKEKPKKVGRPKKATNK